MYLTEKQKRVYKFIKEYIEENDLSPSYTEIKEYFGFSSLNAVYEHIDNLVRKGFVQKGSSNQKRSITLTGISKRAVSLPMVGLVRAGAPIDAYELREYIDVPEEILAKGENVALTVTGNSMIESSICDGDVIIVRRQNTAENGQIVVALINNQATVKEIHFHENQIELRPRNSEMNPIFVNSDDDFQIYGVLVGMYRKYR
ncbi:MAG: transcriptional repressor LexA [Spirochaetes bacterium]|nr:transcriptional repressor LexA [Spirochaetota bacterium]